MLTWLLGLRDHGGWSHNVSGWVKVDWLQGTVQFINASALVALVVLGQDGVNDDASAMSGGTFADGDTLVALDRHQHATGSGNHPAGVAPLAGVTASQGGGILSLLAGNLKRAYSNTILYTTTQTGNSQYKSITSDNPAVIFTITKRTVHSAKSFARIIKDKLSDWLNIGSVLVCTHCSTRLTHHCTRLGRQSPDVGC